MSVIVAASTSGDFKAKGALGRLMCVIIWEFRVKPGRSHEFVSAYKADGNWARLFGLADGYAGTELLNSVDDEGRFLTVDRWRHATDSLSFQEQFEEEYRSLDTQLDGLTESETKLGAFTAADALPLSDVKALLPASSTFTCVRTKASKTTSPNAFALS